MSIKGYRMIFDTVGILIDAEIMRSSWIWLVGELLVLTHFTHEHHDRLKWDLSFATAGARKYSFLADLLKMFIMRVVDKADQLNDKHDMLKSCWFDSIWSESRWLVDMLGDIPEQLVPFDDMMESLGEMFCCVMMCGVVDSFYALSKRFSNAVEDPTDDFIPIAAYSQPGRSNRLITLIL